MTLSLRLHHALEATTLDVSFDAPPGVTVLFGPSGAGKTTVLRAVAGLLTPDDGRITLAGRQVFGPGINLPPHKRRVGYVFQEPRLMPHLNVARNLDYGARLTRRPPPLPRARIIDILGIGALMDRRPATLSGGERQRVAIGRALLAAPDILLADEPLSALDAGRKQTILRCFETLRDDLNIPILYVTHDPAETARLATTVAVLDQGRLTRMGPASAVLSDPAVTPLGSARAGALIQATVHRHHPDGITELRAGPLPLLLPQVDHPPGTPLRIRIEAQDVLIAKTSPRDISALNIWPATVTHLRLGTGPGALVQLDCQGTTLLARITARSARTLALAPGAQVHAILKAVSTPQHGIGT